MRLHKILGIMQKGMIQHWGNSFLCLFHLLGFTVLRLSASQSELNYTQISQYGPFSKEWCYWSKVTVYQGKDLLNWYILLGVAKEGGVVHHKLFLPPTFLFSYRSKLFWVLLCNPPRSDVLSTPFDFCSTQVRNKYESTCIIQSWPYFPFILLLHQWLNIWFIKYIFTSKNIISHYNPCLFL